MSEISDEIIMKHEVRTKEILGEPSVAAQGPIETDTWARDSVVNQNMNLQKEIFQ